METLSPKNPYPGLRPFDESDSSYFYGRDDDLEELLTRIFSHRFLAIIGASGSGKSSIIRAGLVPLLRREKGTAGAAVWRIAQMRPQGDPFGQLAQSLVVSDALAGTPNHPMSAESVTATLMEGPRSLELLAKPLLPRDSRLLIIVDQFEDLFRYQYAAANQASATEVTARFIDLLIYSVTQSNLPTYVLITMRAEYLGQCSAYNQLAEKITDGLFLLAEPTRSQLRNTITEPAKSCGVEVTDPLVSQLLNDLDGTSDRLPSLQHCLMRMWDERVVKLGRTQLVRVEDYADGSVRTSIGDHAQDIYSRLIPDKEKELVERAFKAITTVNSQNETVRNPATIDQITHGTSISNISLERAIVPFRAATCAMLLPASHYPIDGSTVIDISHESLIRQWKTLRDWAKEEADENRPLLWIREELQLWLEKNKKEEYLGAGQKLIEMCRWRARGQKNEMRLTTQEREFLDRSLGDAGVARIDLYEILKAKSEEWDRNKRDKEFLLRGNALREAINWREWDGSIRGVRLTQLQHDYITRSENVSKWRNLRFVCALVAIIFVAGAWVWEKVRDNDIRSNALADTAMKEGSRDDFRYLAYRMWLSRNALESLNTERAQRARHLVLGEILGGSIALKESSQVDLKAGKLLYFAGGEGRFLTQGPRGETYWWNATDNAWTIAKGSLAAVSTDSQTLTPSNDLIRVVEEAHESGNRIDTPKLGSDGPSSQVTSDVAPTGSCRPFPYRVERIDTSELVGCLPNPAIGELVGLDGLYIAAATELGVYLVDVKAFQRAGRNSSDYSYIKLIRRFTEGDGVSRWGFHAWNSNESEPRRMFLCVSRNGAVEFQDLKGGLSSNVVTVPSLGGKSIDATVIPGKNDVEIRTLGMDSVVRTWQTTDYYQIPSGSDALSRPALFYGGKDGGGWYTESLSGVSLSAEGNPEQGPGVTISIDGNWLTSRGVQTVQYRQGKTQKCEIPSTKIGATSIAPLPAGHGFLEYSKASKRIRLLRISQGEQTCKEAANEPVSGDIVSLAATGQGTGFVSIEKDALNSFYIRRWKMGPNGSLTAGDARPLEKSIIPTSIQSNPSGRYLFASGTDGLLRYVDAASRDEEDFQWKTHKLLGSMPEELIRSGPALRFSANGDRLGIVFPGRTTFILYISDHGPLTPMPVNLDTGPPADIEDIFFDHSGQSFATINGDGSIRVFSHASDGQFREERVYSAVGAGGFAPAGTASPINVAMPKLVEGLYSSDDSTFAVLPENGNIRVYPQRKVKDEDKAVRDYLLDTISNSTCDGPISCWSKFKEQWDSVGVPSSKKFYY